ncbi:tripartite tricarboxylate transporter substrate binding protein [Pseudoroseomonas cervicalis]|uniref:Bug family tripartite tricarboxylate transporter substrate binding protein n=1 Tax=Teichococcus cervicalis TaxID=204525 RepID=UPI0022F195FE|nr:tripartite tricarboxylate transporter substrate binding protein [Pseudoroseomonas cervicalis]WBV45296.1 tripartite tricarboxylate transporter substrate binding protein [Pseudoroseomonas cervicalis]
MTTKNTTPPMLGRRGFAGAAAGLAMAPLLGGLSRPALGNTAAAAWPDRPVRMVVPFGAGGAVDTLARSFGQRFPEFANGQPLVIENRSGAGGMVAGAYVTGQPADGYTLMMADIGANAIGKLLNRQLSYDPMTGFTPIMHGANLHAALVSNPQVPQKTVAELIEAARAKPDSLVYASAGVGNGSHLFMALLERQAKISMVHIPYRSGSETALAVMRNETQFCFPTLSSVLGMVRGGQLRVLAMGGGPCPQAPEAPLLRDTIPGFDVAIWYGVAAPPGMNPALADRINEVFNRIAALPEVRRSVEESQAGNIVAGPRQQFADFLKREHDRWAPVIQEGGIRVE